LEELLLVKGVDEEIFYGSARAGEQEQKIKLTPEELDLIVAGTQPAAEEEDAGDKDESDNATGKALGLTDIFFAAYPELLRAAGYKEKTTVKIDINTANINQLLFLEGMNMATAQKIISQRAEQRYVSENDPRLMGMRNHEVWKSQITASKKASRQGLFKITSTGLSPDGRVARSIACTMILQKKGCSIINWRALN
ncbi:MAG: helix-hairpin-helix domain-containing protein, partial [Pseudomonadota bacterium]